MTARISHWTDGTETTGTSGRTGPVFNPATGVADRRGRPRVRPPRSTPPSRRPRRPPASWRSASLSRRSGGAVRASASCSHATADELAAIITAEHGKVLSDAHGRGRRAAWRTSSSPAASPQLLKGGFSEQAAHRRRRLLDPPAARRGRRHHAVQLPGDGAAVDVRQRDRRAATRSSSSRARRTRRPSLFLAELLEARPACPTASSPWCTATRRRSTRILDPPGHRGGQLRRLDPDRPLHLRDRHRARQAGAGPRRREEPHGRAARRRHRHGRRRRGLARPTARPASAAWRSRSSSRSATSADPLVDAIAARLPKLRIGDGTDPDAEMGPLITGEHRDKVAGYIAAGARGGRDGGRRRSRGRRARRDGFFLGTHAARPRHARR